MIRGIKYIFRSDILYCRNEPPQLCDSESLAISYLEQAKTSEKNGIHFLIRTDNEEQDYFFFFVLSCEGDFEGAISWYKKAFKLCPTLEDKKVI